jgi:hypothetical protein
VGVEVESRAQGCPAWPVAGGGCADRCHVLVPVGCAGQPGPVRGCVSLRTLARRALRAGGGGCPASPGRGACWPVPGRSGLGPVAAADGGGRGDHGCGFELVHDGADGHGCAGTVDDGRGLMGQAAAAQDRASLRLERRVRTRWISCDRSVWLPARAGSGARPSMSRWWWSVLACRRSDRRRNRCCLAATPAARNCPPAPAAVIFPSLCSRSAPALSSVLRPQSTPSATVCPVRWVLGTGRV